MPQAAGPVILEHYGEDAPVEAAMRADVMSGKGNLDGYVVWKRVLNAVEELSRSEPTEGATLQCQKALNSVRERKSSYCGAPKSEGQ